MNPLLAWNKKKSLTKWATISWPIISLLSGIISLLFLIWQNKRRLMRSLFCAFPHNSWKPKKWSHNRPVCTSSLSLLRNGSVNMFPRQTCTQLTLEELMDASFSTRSMSYQSKFCMSVSLYPPSLLGNGSVNTSARQRRNVVLYAVCIVSKETRWSVFPTTSFSSCTYFGNSSVTWIHTRVPWLFA
jgi:hypothetical protein